MFDGSNLGIGVAPSAWGSSFKSIDVNAYTSFYGTTNNAYSGFSQNAYYNGTNWIYRNTNAASNYIQSGGTHVWQTAGSGTAANTITFTSAMTLNASGKLLLGTTSASATETLRVYNSSNSRVLVDQASNGLVLGADGSGPFFDTSGSNRLGFFVGGTQRMSITTGGSLILGTGASSTSYTMSVYPSSGDGTIEAKGPGAYLFLNSVNSGFSAVFGYDNGAGRWVVGQLGRGGSDGASIYYGSGNTEAARFASTITTYRALLLSGGMADTYSGSLTGNYTSGTWYAIANSGNLGSGIFVLQLFVDTYYTGSVYYMNYASVPFYMYNVSSNNNATFDLPTMFGTGHANNGVAAPPVRLRITSGGAGIFVDIQPNQTWTGLDNTGGRIVSFNFKRIA